MNDASTGSMDAAESPAPPVAGAPGPGEVQAVAPPPVPHAGVRYAVLRLALLVTVGGVLYLVGMRGWALLFVAVLASGVLSFFVFARQREAAARNLEASVAARSQRRHPHDDVLDESADPHDPQGDADTPPDPTGPQDEVTGSADPAGAAEPPSDSGVAQAQPGA